VKDVGYEYAQLMADDSLSVLTWSVFGHPCSKARQPCVADFKLDESAVNSWAYDLMGDNHLCEATESFKLNVTLYPESSSAYNSLGDAYLKSGQQQ
jgi:hypothetical protein